MAKIVLSQFSFLLMVLSLAVPILMTQSRGMDFNFSNFQSYNTDGILCVADAKISGKAIELTDNEIDRYSTGGAVYNETTELFSIVSFSTHFQFSMLSYNLSSHRSGGIAFFISSKENAILLARGEGWYGLPAYNNYPVPGLFAVAFRSLTNSVHIIVTNPVHTVGNNSVYRLNFTALNQSLSDGTPKNAWIDYDIKTQHLKVFLSNDTNSYKSQRNQIFSHPIDFSQFLPEDIAVGLSGSAHHSGHTRTILSWSFSTKNRKMKKDRTSPKLAVALGSVAVLCTVGGLLLWGYFAFIRKRKLQFPVSGQTCKETDIDLDKVLEHGPQRFKLEELKVATNDFSETQKLGQGGFGGVYKGTMAKTNQVVAVKRISEGSRQGIKEFISEISTVSRVRHRNLVQILGWCHERDQLLLVYEYMSNGSLDRHLFTKGDHIVLAWNRRYEIACEIASGLLYLHEEWNQCVVHRDIKSSNVMLDSNFSAKLGDFGLARILEHDHLSQTTVTAGTLGYLAPECVMAGKTSPESDVYSFGAVALEIASGRQAVDLSLAEHDMRLLKWVWDLYGQGRVVDAADVRLNGEFETAQMKQLLEVGLWCSHPDAAARPKMRQVLKMLNFEAAVPHLPTFLPMPSYDTIQAATVSASSSIASSTPMSSDVPITSFEHSFASSKSSNISKALLIQEKREGC